MKSKRETASEKLHDWTTDELNWMRRNAHLGAKAIVEKLNDDRAENRHGVALLTLSAVYCMAHDIRVSLRRKGSRAGRRMALPANMRIGDLGEHAADVREGSLDLVEIEARIAGDLKEVSLCPSCGKRPQRNPTTGLCGVCHKQRLTAALYEKAAERAAQRDYDVAKQQAHRAKVCIEDGCTHDANGTGGRCWTHSRMLREGRL